jgi:uncharacterized protein (UPF0262 family)
MTSSRDPISAAALAAAAAAHCSVIHDDTFGKASEEECEQANQALFTVLMEQGVLNPADVEGGAYADYHDATAALIIHLPRTGEIVRIDSRGDVT